MAVVGRLLQFARNGKRIKVPLLKQKDSKEEVTYGYFRVPLYITDQGINIIDVFGSTVIWAYQKKNNKYTCGMTRFGKLKVQNGKRGVIVRGNFIEF